MTEMKLPLVWPMARYRFEMEATTPIVLPDYAGSAIRGAFGRALRRTACMTHEKTCEGCPLRRSCPYATIFETEPPESHALQKFSRVPQPYVIEAPLGGRRTIVPGEIFSFGVVLFGQALRHLALVAYALERAFGYDVARGTARFKSLSLVTDEGEVLLSTAENRTIAEHHPEVRLILSETPRTVRLRFKTPLRLQMNGKAYGPGNIDSGAFLNALVRRASLMREFHAEWIELDFHALAAAATAVRTTSDLHWQDWRRYSTRQQQGMHLGGVVGDWVFYDVPPELQAFLDVGRWLHVGKNATFGLGWYDLMFDVDQ